MRTWTPCPGPALIGGVVGGGELGETRTGEGAGCRKMSEELITAVWSSTAEESTSL